MSYSVNTDTKIATYNSVAYSPAASIKDGVTTLNALSEADCAEFEASREKKPERDLQRLREKRNSILAKSDWMANSDVTMSDKWKTYRQELRNITKTYSSLYEDGFEFPTEPS